MAHDQPRPAALIIRDGWGANPYPKWNECNAVHLARTPVDARLMASFPHVQIRTSGNDVGLPDGVMGNSEVGHQNIGAGRIVEQELMRITSRIRDGAFFSAPKLVEAFDRAKQSGRNVHIMGLCSDGRVHSDLEHLYALLEMSQKCSVPGDRVFVHAFTDGRDTPPDKGITFVRQIEDKCRDLGINPVASVIGRFYSMDRDRRWDRIEKAYRLLVHGEGAVFASATEAIQHYYDHPSESSLAGDEFVEPAIVAPSAGKPSARIADGDSVIFFNYRGDRPRELSKAFVLDEFPFADGYGDSASDGFDRGRKLELFFVTMTQYEQGLPVEVAFGKPQKLPAILGACVSDGGYSQFRCAETEKFAHVTFFFNDYREEPFAGEDRVLVPSTRNVATYDQEPEMSAHGITEAVLARLAKHDDALLVINYANGDMVGHTGDLQAAIRAVETVDECTGRVVEAMLAKGGSLVVTADHGNCEQMIDPVTGGRHTAHTTYDVELIVIDERHTGASLRPGGCLADIAPTMLELMGLSIPDAMTGRSLLPTK